MRLTPPPDKTLKLRDLPTWARYKEILWLCNQNMGYRVQVYAAKDKTERARLYQTAHNGYWR